MIEISLSGIKMKNPFILASGVLGVTASVMSRIAKAGCGAITSKSIGPEPKAGYVNPTVVELGNGSHSTISPSITGVQNLVYTETDITYSNDSITGEMIRRNIELSSPNVLPNFTEFCLKDSGGNVILYSTFPAINYYELMNDNFRFTFISV